MLGVEWFSTALCMHLRWVGKWLPKSCYLCNNSSYLPVGLIFWCALLCYLFWWGSLDATDEQCFHFSDCSSCTANTKSCQWSEDKKCISASSNCTQVGSDMRRHLALGTVNKGINNKRNNKSVYSHCFFPRTKTSIYFLLPKAWIFMNTVK